MLTRRPPKLTNQERRIVRFIADGLTTKQIGKQLGISPNTVDGYRANILRKLALDRSTALVAWAVKEGIA